LVKSAYEFYIISPYLMESFDAIFCELKDTNVKMVHLVTTLRRNDPDLRVKAKALQSFCSLCSKYKIEYKVYRDDKLHGKIYAASRSGSLTCCILTSANFTESGLKSKHEWGVWLEDKTVVNTIISEVLSMCSHPLSKRSISGIIDKIEKYVKTTLCVNVPPFELSLDEFIEPALKAHMADNRNEVDVIEEIVEGLGSKYRPRKFLKEIPKEFTETNEKRDIIWCYTKTNEKRDIIWRYEKDKSDQRHKKHIWKMEGSSDSFLLGGTTKFQLSKIVGKKEEEWVAVWEYLGYDENGKLVSGDMDIIDKSLYYPAFSTFTRHFFTQTATHFAQPVHFS